jgi:hypothetical protein
VLEQYRRVGFSGSRKSTPYAATVALEKVLEEARQYGVRELKVYIKGPGPGRDAVLRVLKNSEFHLNCTWLTLPPLPTMAPGHAKRSITDKGYMARNIGPKNKLMRRSGMDLGFKTNPAKLTRRLNIPPGQHGRKGARKLSDYGIQLREKQKVKWLYGILEKQFRRYFEKLPIILLLLVPNCFVCLSSG